MHPPRGACSKGSTTPLRISAAQTDPFTSPIHPRALTAAVDASCTPPFEAPGQPPGAAASGGRRRPMGLKGSGHQHPSLPATRAAMRPGTSYPGVGAT